MFKDQARRSTDLRDRFRNAFPELYQAAGYKPRSATSSGSKTKTKKSFGKQSGRGLAMGVRAATDDQLAMSSTRVGMDMGAGPVRRRRSAHTTGLLRGGTKSVPQSTACSEDEDSDSGVDELDPEEYLEMPSGVFRSPPTPVLVDNVSTLPTRRFGGLTVGSGTIKAGKETGDPFTDDMEMEMVALDQLSSNPLGTSPPFLPGRNHNNSGDIDTPAQSWPSGLNTPTHSNHAWSTAAGSPTSSHLSTDYEYLLNSGTHSHSHSPSFSHTRTKHNNDADADTNNTESSSMIGKSAWGTQDWLFSSNPRLDHSSSASTSNSSSSYISLDASAHSHGLSLSPPPFSSFPFTHHALTSTHGQHLSYTSHAHGVLDRYDLLPAASSLSLSQHAHLHDFASDIGAGGGGADEFSDADAEFPPSGFRGFTHHSNYAGDLIFGARGPGSGLGAGLGHSYYGFGSSSGTGGANTFGYGLGLSGMGRDADAGVAGEGIQSMQLALPGIDEIEIAGITLEDSQQQEPGESQPSDEDGDVVIESPGADSPNASSDNGDGDLRLDVNIELGHNHSRPHPQEPQGKNEPRRPTLMHSHSLTHLTANPHSPHPEFKLDLDDIVDFSRSQPPGDDSQLDLDLELHHTPPGTPLLASVSSFSVTHANLSVSPRPRSARRSSESIDFHHYHNYNHDSGSGQHHHGRSISVPPSEMRVRATPGTSGSSGLGSRLGRGQEQKSVSKKNTMGASGSDNSGKNSRDPPVGAGPRAEHIPSLSFPPQILLSTVSQDMWGSMASVPPSAAGDINLSFLDLHYYGGGVGGQGIIADDMLSRHGGWGGSGRQALDLAAPPSSLTSAMSLRALGIPASLGQHIPHLGPGGGATSDASGKGTWTGVRNNSGFHQRGQSVVCPKDLMLKSGDNKRKRASWDGAHV